MDADKAFLDALAELDAALNANIERAHMMQRRSRDLREALEAGRSLRDLVPNEHPPLIVNLLTESAHILHTVGTRVRRTEARALHDAGVSMDEIARLFGVSRQRISALLRGENGHDE